VVLAANIGTDGMLHNLRVISGSPVLRDEALSAARQWRYIPAMLSGKPVETDTRITISFHHQ
jgi:TonB family protein